MAQAGQRATSAAGRRGAARARDAGPRRVTGEGGACDNAAHEHGPNAKRSAQLGPGVHRSCNGSAIVRAGDLLAYCSVDCVHGRRSPGRFRIYGRQHPETGRHIGELCARKYSQRRKDEPVAPRPTTYLGHTARRRSEEYQPSSVAVGREQRSASGCNLNSNDGASQHAGGRRGYKHGRGLQLAGLGPEYPWLRVLERTNPIRHEGLHGSHD